MVLLDIFCATVGVLKTKTIQKKGQRNFNSRKDKPFSGNYFDITYTKLIIFYQFVC